MELYRALATLCERPAPQFDALAEALGIAPAPKATEYTSIVTLELRPRASIYLSPDGLLGGEPQDRIAGFWRAVGLEPPPECDHLAVLLAFYAALHERTVDADTDEARAAHAHLQVTFLHEHLLSWLPVYLSTLRRLGSPFYTRWAELLTSALQRDLASDAGASRPSRHLLEISGSVTTEDDEGALPSLLVAPARCGLILTRADLRSAARTLGLAARIGERRYMLENLLGQQPRAVLQWLAEHFRQESRRRRADTGWGNVLDPWTLRLESTAARIDEALGAVSEA